MPKDRQADLFGPAPEEASARPARAALEHAPLAERMRPVSLEEIVGQGEILKENSFLGRILRGGRLSSCILWGPPGTGKTTIARLLAARESHAFESLSAVLAGVKNVREVIARAQQRRRHDGRGTVLFVDEIHRFNKAQQDAFLPHVESGVIVLVGATTENPSFEVIGPLLSRCRVVVLEPLGPNDLAVLIRRALADAERGLGKLELSISEEALAFLAGRAGGDARVALGALEAAASIACEAGAVQIDLALAEQGLQKRALLYDRAGDEHYNVISAFIKSMRGSDVDAALYWLARMLEAGEDPLFIARRMVVFASEDVGLADPHALPLAIAVKDAVHFVGLPEARINLAHGVAYLSRAPKSNSAYMAGEAAASEVRTSGHRPVPQHLRNAPTRLMKDLGYGRGYVYPHGSEAEARRQRYLPEGLGDARFFELGPRDQPHPPESQADRRRPGSGRADGDDVHEEAPEAGGAARAKTTPRSPSPTARGRRDPKKPNK